MSKYSDHITDILKERGYKIQEIEKMSPDQVFSEVLEWDGVIGRDRAIKRWIKDIYGIDVKVFEEK